MHRILKLVAFCLLLIPVNISAQDMMVWIENKGQLHHPDGTPANEVFYYAQLSGLDLFLTRDGLSYVVKERKKKEQKIKGEERRKESDRFMKIASVPYHRFDLKLEGGNIDPARGVYEQRKQGVLHLWDVPGRPEGIRDIKEYDHILLRDVYPGIDWALYFRETAQRTRTFKHEFIVHPGADPSAIRMHIEGSQLDVNEDQLLVRTQLGEVNLGKLLTLQEGEEVESSYVYDGKTISHKLAKYNRSKELVIDPELIWSTYYGGTFLDGPEAVGIDAQGNQYVAGYTSAVPGAFPLQPGPGYYDAVSSLGFLLKFNADGARVYATFYGMLVRDLDIDSAQNVVVVGYAGGGNPSLFQHLPGAYNQNIGTGEEGIIAKFDSAGNRLWCTAFGGGGEDRIYTAAFDQHQHLYVAGFTQSGNFPLQSLPGAYNQNNIGGGKDIFIARFNEQGALLWSTFVGGAGVEEAFDIRIDKVNRPYLVGYTFSQNFPLQPSPGAYYDSQLTGGGSKGFITRFGTNGTLEWSTLFGSSGGADSYDPNQVADVAFDSKNNVYAIGKAHGIDLPLKQKAGAYFKPNGSGDYDMFVAQFSGSGEQLWTTYF